MKNNPIIDGFIARLLSRKLIVFILATIGLYLSNLTSSDWVTISAIYLSVEGAADIVGRFISKK
jgi:hypothetical protein